MNTIPALEDLKYLEKIYEEITKLRWHKEQEPTVIRYQDTDYYFTSIDRISTTNTSYKDKADHVVKNTQNKALFIDEISMIPDSTAKTNLSLIGKTTDGLTFLEIAGGSLTDTQEYIFKPTKRLVVRQGVDLEFFIKTSSGTSKISIAVTLTD